MRFSRIVFIALSVVSMSTQALTNGDLMVGIGYVSYPQDRLRPLEPSPGLGADQTYEFTVLDATFSKPFSRGSLALDAFAQANTDTDEIEDTTSAWLRQAYVRHYFGQAYELTAGRINLVNGHGKATRLVDYYLFNRLVFDAPMSIQEAGKYRIGNLGVNMSAEFNNQSLSLFIAPRVDWIKDSNEENSYLMKYVPYWFENAQLEFYWFQSANRNHIGHLNSTQLGQRTLFYSEWDVVDEAQILLMSTDSQSAAVEQKPYDLRILLGVDQALSANVTATAEYIYRKQGYSDSQAQALFDVLVQPDHPDYYTVHYEMPYEFYYKHYLYGEIEWHSFASGAKTSVGLLAAPDQSYRITLNAGLTIKRSFEIRLGLSYNNGPQKSEFGSLARQSKAVMFLSYRI